MAQPSSDKKQIGLTADGQRHLDRIMALDIFGTESDAYKLAIAYALAKGLDYDSAPSGGYQTKFNSTGGLDRDGTVRDLISHLRPDLAARPYAAAERLAELGVAALASRLEQHESLADIIADSMRTQDLSWVTDRRF